jgi:hypothetical protein
MHIVQASDDKISPPKQRATTTNFAAKTASEEKKFAVNAATRERR